MAAQGGGGPSSRHHDSIASCIAYITKQDETAMSAAAAQVPSPLGTVRSLTFDLMGTCADWLTSILTACRALPEPVPPCDLRQLAMDWRSGFFEAIFASFSRGEQSPNIDIVHRQVLDRLVDERGIGNWADGHREQLVRAWHRQVAWPDVIPGIQRLREKFDVVVLANGTTRLQLDILSSSGIPFHMAFSSQLIGHTKPDPAMYRRCLELLDRRPEEVAMVAAHAYDLRAAKAIGMRTIYIRRDTEDPDEDFDKIRAEVDVYVDGRSSAGPDAGMQKVAELLQA